MRPTPEATQRTPEELNELREKAHQVALSVKNIRKAFIWKICVKRRKRKRKRKFVIRVQGDISHCKRCVNLGKMV